MKDRTIMCKSEITWKVDERKDPWKFKNVTSEYASNPYIVHSYSGELCTIRKGKHLPVTLGMNFM